MSKELKLVNGSLLVALMFPQLTYGAVIDFEEFTGYQGGTISLQDTSVTSNGFLLTGSSVGRALYPQYIIEPQVGYWNGEGNNTHYFTQYPRNNGGWTSGALTITSLESSTFSLEGFDVGQHPGSWVTADQLVEVIGTRIDNSTVIGSFSTWDTSHSFGDDWSSLAALTFSNLGVQGYISIDNIALAPSSVPLPPAIWLFGSGLLGLLVSMRKDKQS